MPLVEILQFTYTYPGENKPALRDINLSIESGSFVIITGESGSGKSTLGKAIAGFLFQDEEPNYSGKVVVNGTDMSQVPLFDACERVTYVQQNPEDQFCTLTVRDEIAFGLENLCMDPGIIDKRIDLVLEIVKGSDLRDRDLSTLSGGEKQKIAIASMLALSPDVVILDEPTSNLDPIATKHIFETLHHIQQTQNLTTIIIEHKLSQLHVFNPMIIELDQGQITRNKQFQSDDVYPASMDKVAQDHMPFPELNKGKTDSLIELSQLNVSLGGKKILSDIDLTLFPGEFVALMGPNGSGKSTLLETIMGFHHIQAGFCSVFKQDLDKVKTSELVSDIGYIFQNPDHQLFTQSVRDEAIFTLKNLRISPEKIQSHTVEWLKKVRLDDRLEDHPQRLSYGEKRRLNLVASMLHEPKLLLIDELLIGQDMTNAHAWMSVLTDYVHQGHTVLLVIHHANLTRDFCDRIIFLEHGKIIVDAPTKTAFQVMHAQGYSSFCPESQWELSYA